MPRRFVWMFVTNVFSCAELSKHPAIQEVAVISHPHQFWGERPLALAILHPSSHRKYQHQRGEGKFETELKDWVKKEGRLSGFAIPEWVRIVEELPKTATGKIMKNVLREKWKSRKLESAIPSEGEKAKL
jgi:acyl-coenzyme A synthetase/AMP-(fatty) acid ligase